MLVLAHGLVGRQDLPIPRWLFAWAAAVVLVVSFVGLAALWPTPRLQAGVAERVRIGLGPRPLVRAWEVLAGLIGVGLFGLVVYAGFKGSQTETANFAPTWIYVVFWVGLPIASLLLGDVFRAFNPWRAVARAIAGIAKSVGGEGLPEPIPYPERLGRWPAVAGILGFAWLELCYTNRGDPSILAALALGYAAVMLVGISVYGVETWTDRGDAFSVYFGLFARLSPIHWVDGRLKTRAILGGAPQLPAAAGTTALLAAMIGSTSFDGFSVGPTWTSLAPHLQSFFVDLGFTAETGLELGYTVGLAAMVLVVYGLYRLGVAGMMTVRRGPTARQLSEQFAHTLIPIALAYVVAHYFSLLVYNGQAVLALHRSAFFGYLASDPLGNGTNVFGTADTPIHYGVVSATQVWYVQVAALVLGHAAGLALAHDRALALYKRSRDATRSQYWMLAVMVAFTSLGLWLLSAAA